MENVRAFFNYVHDYMIEKIEKGEMYKIKGERIYSFFYYAFKRKDFIKKT